MIVKDKGYIALYRKIQDNFLWKEKREFSKAEAWIDILMEVQYSEAPRKVVFGMHTLTCNYGESLKTLETWARRWNWTRSKVRRFFKLIQNEKMVVVKSAQLTTRLTVCNYGTYDPKRHSKRNANDTQATTDNKGKKDKKENIFHPTSDEVRLSTLLFDLIRQRKRNQREPDIQKWSVHIGRLIRLDKRSPPQIEAVIRWCQADDFWQNNILSTEKLRAQIDQLELKMQQKHKSKEAKQCYRMRCRKMGVAWAKDSTDQVYWMCDEHKHKGATLL